MSVDGFATTRWSLIWMTARENPVQGRPAFAELFQRYWQPLYYAARRHGLQPADAEDALNEFFCELLSGSLIEKAQPELGKFRSLLITAWKRFLIDRHRNETAQKRGGGVQQLSLDIDVSEANWQRLSRRDRDLESVYLAGWAESVLKEVESRMRDEYERRNRGAHFKRLFAVLNSQLNAADYEAIAEDLRIRSGAAKVAVHRLRKRFGETLRSVIAETVQNEDEIDVEIDALLSAIR